MRRAKETDCDYRQRLSLEDICEVNVWSCWIFFTHSCTPMKGYYIDPQACVIWNFKLCLPDGDQISPLCCQRLTQTPHWMGSLLATMKEEGGKRKEKKLQELKIYYMCCHVHWLFFSLTFRFVGGEGVGLTTRATFFFRFPLWMFLCVLVAAREA